MTGEGRPGGSSHRPPPVADRNERACHVISLLDEAAGAAALTAAAGALYSLLLAAVALTSVLSRSAARRRDARETLRILVWRRGSGAE